MTTILFEGVGNRALIDLDELRRVLDLARHGEIIELKEAEHEITTRDMMRLADAGGAFAFWNEPGEDIYTLNDGEPV